MVNDSSFSFSYNFSKGVRPASEVVLEDFMRFVVNPVVSIKEFNPDFANYYPWLKIGKFQIPLLYVTEIAIAVLSWYFI